ncbi:MAG: hypothetical protein QHH18_00050 [Candidatus Bathyarchaeota archaeon]|jgi:DNA-binding IscR family transcriptional regulator|nr:hypothetical protein [Candidatus Bathyarchaeota archaeon A05DMB-5]MDH7556984.1 hypothetical protein [Candidatus Bathyarchaeota archaeon]
MLSDGEWHQLKEIQQEVNLNKKQLHQVIAFLRKYSFIIADEEHGKIKLEKTVQQFLSQAATS